MINYYKDHISRRSEQLAPLTALTKKNTRFNWTSQCQQSFDSLRAYLAKCIVLAFPDFTLPFDIHTDASKIQIGAVIHQRKCLVAFYSCKLMDAQICH